MANQTNQRLRIMPVTRLLLMAALGLGLAASPICAGQASSTGSNAKTSSKSSTSRKSAASKEETSSSTSSSSWAGKRDPFKVPEEETGGGHSDSGVINGGVNLPPGERGLVISQLILEGTVREIPENKMIAVVTNETKRAYFLRENQSVYNGVVSKITPDAVYFTENVLDAEGRVTTREVVKRLSSAPGEGR